LFFPGSRYIDVVPYSVTRPDGTAVLVTRTPAPRPRAVLGYYRRNVGDRLDQISGRFLADATLFWHVCDANGAVVPDALAARPLIGVPIDALKGG
jgi:hypothetical protein